MIWGIGAARNRDSVELTIVADGKVAPLSNVLESGGSSTQLPVGGLRALLPDWDRWCDVIASAVAHSDTDSWTAEDAVLFEPPIGDPSAIYCCGANYYDHIAEMKSFDGFNKAAQEVFHFLVPPGALIGHRQAVRRPVGCKRLDWEVEVVCVIGRRAENVPVAQALRYVAGYTVGNDISLRDSDNRHPVFGLNFLFAKGQRTMKPIGPAVVPARMIDDPQRLPLSLTVNGIRRQNSSTDKMIWSLPEQIAYLSSLVTLHPGDLIFTGTPAGTAISCGEYLQDGDEVVASVETLGTLRNSIASGA